MNNEREISIVDLMWRILFGWRFVLVFAVVCTIIGGLISYRNYSTAMDLYVASDAPIQLDDKEKAQVEMVAQLVSEADGLEEYLTNSLYVHADPYNLKVANIIFVMEFEDLATAGLNIYQNAFLGEELALQIGTVLKVDESKYVRELISVSATEMYEKNAMAPAFCPPNGGIITVRVICPDESYYSSVSDTVISFARDYYSDVEDLVGKHSLVVASSELDTIVDRTMANKQVSEIGSLAGVRTTANNALSSLTSAQRLYYDSMMAGTPEVVTKSGVAPSFSKKYVALGFVLGVFLACAWIACKTIFATRLQNREELESQYHIRMLGAFDSQRKYKGIDKLFYTWRHSGEKKLTQEERVDIICSNIAILCEKGGLKDISVTGTCICEANRGLFESIVGELKNKGLSADAEESIIYNTASLKSVTQSGAVVIVEQVDVSKYKEIEQELITLKGNDINILGCVGIE